jgi:ArsR family transcriptional regulator
MDALLPGLRAIAEPTRLRLLALLGHSELTVTEVTQILGQSQPRVSRHLKLMCEAGLLDRFREGTWAFYRLTEKGECAELAHLLVDLIPADDPVYARDLERLEAIKAARAEAAAEYFRNNAANWSKIRSLYVPEAQLEAAMLEILGHRKIDDFLDVGTGTGRMLTLFAPRIKHGIGYDMSHEMLALARTNLDEAGVRNCQVRLGDMYSLPMPNESVDVVLFHLVLHYADDPAAAIQESARLLRPGGEMLIVDFAPHGIEFLRTEHAHRRLGFSDQEVEHWLKTAGLDLESTRHFAGTELTVNMWHAINRRPPRRNGGH